jgi:hypothetical protein
MQEEKLVSYIQDNLSKFRDQDEIIIGICKMTNLTWEKAEAILDRVQTENEISIARRQFPLFFIVAFIFFVTGLMLTGYGVYGTLLSFSKKGGMPDDLTTYFMPIIQTGLDPLEVIKAAIPSYFQLIIYFIFSPVSALILGISMIIGSFNGLSKEWAVIIK